MFLGNDEKVYILGEAGSLLTPVSADCYFCSDKAENNAATINGHPAWASVWYGRTAAHDVRLR